MSVPNERNQSPQGYWNTVQPAPKKPFPTALVVLSIVGLFIALAVVGSIKIFHAAQSGSAAAIAAGNKFIEDIGQHRFSAARALMTAEIQAKTPASTLQDVETLVEKHHGACVAHGQPQWFIQNYNGQTSVRLSYPVQFSKSTSPVSMIVVPTNNGYRVYGTHYDF